ncbi:MAG: hypothetical protein HZA34_00635 [Candidatus Pacebacteria bacterium]|nr:hypothetical protein [Candidatus Paceibacterota bacterium]
MGVENTIELKEELVKQVVADLKKENPKVDWGEGEFAYVVFESLVIHFNLRLIELETGLIPDMSDPTVVDLSRQLKSFKTLLEI